MATLYEYYITGDNDGWVVPVYDIGDALAQTFTPSISHTVTQVRLKLYRISTPGTLNINIYSVDGSHFPTGGSLASGTINGDIITTNIDGEYRNVTLGTTVLLTAGTEYALVLTAPNGTPWNVEIVWKMDLVDASYARGWAIRYIGTFGDPTPQNWQIFSAGSASDFVFQEWGEAATPSKPVNPTPANNATEIDFSAFLLAWDDGGDADTYNVYIGSTGDLTLVSSAQANTGYLTTLEELETIFDSSPINQKIYWRVDATNDGGTTTGDEWNFDPRPAKASNPSPEDEYTPMTLDWQLFSWDAVDNADTYSVYMGTEVGETPWSENMELIVDSSPLSYIVQSYLATATKLVYPYTGLAVYNYQYYWRVDAKNIFGETTGDSWSLTTITFDPPVSSYRGDFSGVEGIDWNWDGKNNMIIVKRLFAAADNKIWYEDI